MPIVKSDENRNARTKPLEKAMEDMINLHKKPVGNVDLDEVAALTRHLGVRANMEGGSHTVGELITATGIVMEETGAKVVTRGNKAMPLTRRRSSGRSYFFFGGMSGK